MMYGCENPPTQIDIVNKMKCPVILMSETAETTSHYGRILLLDGDNNMCTMKTNKTFGRMIYETYDVGDTIKKCRDNDNNKIESHNFVE